MTMLLLFFLPTSILFIIIGNIKLNDGVTKIVQKNDCVHVYTESNLFKVI